MTKPTGVNIYSEQPEFPTAERKVTKQQYPFNMLILDMDPPMSFDEAPQVFGPVLYNRKTSIGDLITAEPNAEGYYSDISITGGHLYEIYVEFDEHPSAVTQTLDRVMGVSIIGLNRPDGLEPNVGDQWAVCRKQTAAAGYLNNVVTTGIHAFYEAEQDLILNPFYGTVEVERQAFTVPLGNKIVVKTYFNTTT